MINLFDAGFLHILFDPKARLPRDKTTGKPIIDRAQDRIDYLVQTLGQRRDKIIIPTPALAEFLLLASDRRNEYLSIIRKKAIFEIAGFDDPEVVELVEHWMKEGNKKLKPNTPETWAKLKYDRQILAIAITRRVETIYSADDDLRKFAESVNIKYSGLADLDLPPPRQLLLDKVNVEGEKNVVPFPSEIRGSGQESSADQSGDKETKGEEAT